MWRFWKSAFFVLLIGLVLYCVVFISLNDIPWFFRHRVQQRRVLILCNTNHQALLKAGREILSKIPKDRLNPQPDGTILWGSFNIPEGIQIPKAIRDLKPRCRFVDYDGFLTLEMNRLNHWMVSFGVNIYPEDYKNPDPYFKYGDRELIPGLWYYDEGYLRNPEYDKRINELIEKHKKNGNN